MNVSLFRFNVRDVLAALTMLLIISGVALSSPTSAGEIVASDQAQLTAGNSSVSDVIVVASKFKSKINPKRFDCGSHQRTIENEALGGVIADLRNQLSQHPHMIVLGGRWITPSGERCESWADGDKRKLQIAGEVAISVMNLGAAK